MQLCEYRQRRRLDRHGEQYSRVDVAHGAGSAGQIGVGSDVANECGTIENNDSTLNAGRFLGVPYNGTDTAGSGTVILQGSSTLNATAIHIGMNGLFGGQGSVNGNVHNFGGLLQVGASTDALIIRGDFTQTGGAIHFEVDPDGHGGFLFSTLTLDADKLARISGAHIVFDFAGGADQRER